MALNRDRKKPTAADVVEGLFTRATARVPTVDGAGNPTGHTDELRTGLTLRVGIRAADGTERELHIYVVADTVLTPTERRAMLTAAWQSLPAAKRTAVLDAVWADYLAKHDLAEVP